MNRRATYLEPVRTSQAEVDASFYAGRQFERAFGTPAQEMPRSHKVALTWLAIASTVMSASALALVLIKVLGS